MINIKHDKEWYAVRKYISQKYNCGNCTFSYYNTKDIKESQKCVLVGVPNNVPINKRLETLIAKYNIKSVCEVWQPKVKA